MVVNQLVRRLRQLKYLSKHCIDRHVLRLPGRLSTLYFSELVERSPTLDKRVRSPVTIEINKKLGGSDTVVVEQIDCIDEIVSNERGRDIISTRNRLYKLAKNTFKGQFPHFNILICIK